MNYLELTEKEIELIELLKKNSFTKKKKYFQPYGSIQKMLIPILLKLIFTD